MTVKKIMVIGGSRSGKSNYAENLTGTNEHTVYYIATGKVTDAEFQERIRLHQANRPPHWQTIEEELYIDKAIKQVIAGEKVTAEKTEHSAAEESNLQYITILLDSVGTWVANYMYAPNVEDVKQALLDRAKHFIMQLNELEGRVIWVADETGMGVVPESRDGRLFRDLNGMVNQYLAQEADELHLVVSGVAMRVK